LRFGVVAEAVETCFLQRQYAVCKANCIHYKKEKKDGI